MTGNPTEANCTSDLGMWEINSPELVICVSHLVSLEFRHQDLYDPDKNEKVDLETKRKHINLTTTPKTTSQQSDKK